MNTTAADVKVVFEWLSALDSKNLELNVSLDDNSGSFAAENWIHLMNFFQKYTPKESALIMLQRKEANTAANGKNYQTLVGAEYFNPNWTIFLPQFLRNLSQIEPQTLELKKLDAEVIFAKLTDVFPDAPINIT